MNTRLISWLNWHHEKLTGVQIKEALRQAQQYLGESDSPRLDSELLLAHVLRKNREFLLTWPEVDLSGEQEAAFAVLLEQRAGGLPVAYLTGSKAFWDFDLEVSEYVLIPRPETELLVELALERLTAGPQMIADLGTGSGAIALALAKERRDWLLVATDSSPQALAMARRNAQALELDNIGFALGNWAAALQDSTFDAIVSNPPYIDPADPHLQQGDVRFEPRTALVAEEQGLADLTVIARDCREKLKPGGLLLLEHGFEQGEALRKILQDSGYNEIATYRDLAGLERVTLARR